MADHVGRAGRAGRAGLVSFLGKDPPDGTTVARDEWVSKCGYLAAITRSKREQERARESKKREPGILSAVGAAGGDESGGGG